MSQSNQGQLTKSVQCGRRGLCMKLRVRKVKVEQHAQLLATTWLLVQPLPLLLPLLPPLLLPWLTPLLTLLLPLLTLLPLPLLPS